MNQLSQVVQISSSQNTTYTS